MRLDPHRLRPALLLLATAVAIALYSAHSPGDARGGVKAAPARVQRHRPALKMIWGPTLLPNGQSAFATYQRLGVQVLQLHLLWSRVAPTKPVAPADPNDPAYLWPAEIEEAIAQAAHYGIRLSLLVESTPAWANGGRSAEWAPSNEADFASFLVAASRRFPSIHYWMIWGEPNREGNFQPMPANSPVGPRRYALLLNAAYHALKGASSANVVIGGDTWTLGTVSPQRFVQWMRLPDGKPPPLDYYGHNPFSTRFPKRLEPPYYPGLRDIDDIGTLESELAHVYHRQVNLWLSEYTVSSGHSNRAFDFAVGTEEQAHWLAAAYHLVDSLDYVAGLGWYDLLDEPTTAPGALTDGLMSWNLVAKPDFYAYERAR
jgi:hypothetical protein